MIPLTNLTGDFNQDEKILMEYTIQKIRLVKRVAKIQIGILISLILIFSLLGYYFFNFALDEYALKKEYGANYYCYKCGYISGKSCSCVYSLELFTDPDKREEYFLNLGINNAQNCKKGNDAISYIK